LWFLRNLNDPEFHPIQEVRKAECILQLSFIAICYC
jgi:E3 ubiquitin-protein ligase DOA10